MSSNIVITDVIVEPPSPQRFRSGSPSKRSRWLKKEKAREKEPVSYRIQKVFNIMERQGLAMPMDVRYQCDVNDQIYRTLSTLGIEEILYPLPRNNSLLELRTMPIHRFWSEENAHDRYTEKRPSDERDALKLQERRRNDKQRSSQLHGEWPESLDAGCRRPKRDVGPRRGSVPRRKPNVTAQPHTGKDCTLITLPKEWNDHCIVPGKVVCKNFDRDVHEYCKEAEDPNGGKVKTVSLADNYDIAEIASSDLCLAPSCEVNNKIETFLSRQELAMPNQILPEPPRSKLTSNPRYMRHDEKPAYSTGSKGRITTQDVVTEYDNVVHHELSRFQTDGSKSQKAYTEVKGNDGRMSRIAQHSGKLFQSDTSGHDCLPRYDNKTLQVEKSCNDTKESTIKSKKCDKIKRKKDKRHLESKKDHIEPDIVASTSTEDKQTDICLVKVENVLEEHTFACESRSAVDFCETSSGKRVSWASELERDLRAAHSRTSGSRSSRENKPKEKRSSRKQTPVVMYSESECSLLCQKYNN